MKTGIELITEERQKQIEKHGFTAEHHAAHPEWYDKRQLIYAARIIVSFEDGEITKSTYKNCVPLNWDEEWWSRLCDKPLVERIKVAAALLASELDRLNYIEENML